jgi:hypothetical protein
MSARAKIAQGDQLVTFAGKYVHGAIFRKKSNMLLSSCWADVKARIAGLQCSEIFQV